MSKGPCEYSSLQKFHREAVTVPCKASAAAKAGLRAPAAEVRGRQYPKSGRVESSSHGGRLGGEACLDLSSPHAPKSLFLSKSSSPFPHTPLSPLLPSLSRPPESSSNCLLESPEFSLSFFGVLTDFPLKTAPLKISECLRDRGLPPPTLTRRRDHPQSCCSASRTSWLCLGQRRSRTDWQTMQLAAAATRASRPSTVNACLPAEKAVAAAKGGA